MNERTGAINLNTKIWRYLSFDKFIDLVTTEELHFAPASRFEDTWEMYPPASLLNRGNWKEVILRENKTVKDHSVDIESLIDDAIGFYLSKYQNRHEEYSFSCWSRTDQDHAALWNIFTDCKNAVAISTTLLKLIKALNVEKARRFANKIHLISRGQVTNLRLQAE